MESSCSIHFLNKRQNIYFDWKLKMKQHKLSFEDNHLSRCSGGHIKWCGGPDSGLGSWVWHVSSSAYSVANQNRLSSWPQERFSAPQRFLQAFLAGSTFQLLKNYPEPLLEEVDCTVSLRWSGEGGQSGPLSLKCWPRDSTLDEVNEWMCDISLINEPPGLCRPCRGCGCESQLNQEGHQISNLFQTN